MIDEVADVIRKECESCDCPQGFQLTHGIGGGTGSGLGALALLKIRDNYPDRITATYSVFPVMEYPTGHIYPEPYNATLSIDQLLDNSDVTFVIDNVALYRMSERILQQKQPKYADLNWLISLAMTGTSSSLRLPTDLNGDLRTLAVNLVPFPRLHFLSVAHAPWVVTSNGKRKATKSLSVEELRSRLWSTDNCLADIEMGKCLSASCCVRRGGGRVRFRMEPVGERDEFVPWIPNNVKCSVISVAPDGVDVSGTLLANCTGMQALFQRVAYQFGWLFKERYFCVMAVDGDVAVRCTAMLWAKWILLKRTKMCAI